MRSLNIAILVGRLGADVDIKPLSNGNREVATFSIATDASFKDQHGEWQERTDWHRVVTFQKGLIGMLRKHGKKGRLVTVQGELKNRHYVDPNTDEKRWITEIQLNPVHSQVQFLDKLADNIPEQSPPANQADVPVTVGDDDIPF